MEFKGTFNLKLINRVKGETMRKSFRVRMKLAYLAACAAYIAEIVNQVPVLTGASRAALIWRLKEVIDRAKSIDYNLAMKFQIPQFEDNVQISKTLAKAAPHQYPQSGWSGSRELWKQNLHLDGQNEDSWKSDQYVPMIIDTKPGNQYSGKYTFLFAIKDFYLEHYSAGTIDSSPWGWDEQPYDVGPWALHIDGQKAFNKEFERVIKESGVLGLRAVLPGVPVGTPAEYASLVDIGGTIEAPVVEAIDFDEEVPF